MKRHGKLDSSTAECWRRSSYLRRTSSAARCPPARLSPTFAVRESRRDRCGEDTGAYSLPPGAGGRSAQRGRNQSRSRFPPFGRESCLLRDVLCRPRAARLTAARDVTTQRRDFAVRSALLSRSGLLPREFSQWLHDGFSNRQAADYGVELVHIPLEVESLLARAREFVAGVRRHLQPG